jgi:hypothetical protein
MQCRRLSMGLGGRLPLLLGHQRCSNCKHGKALRSDADAHEELLLSSAAVFGSEQA